MEDAVINVDADLLERFIYDIFRGLGVPEKDAVTCSNGLVEADRRGVDSHGVNRMKPFYYDRIRAGLQSPVTTTEILREGLATAVMDGHNGMGFVIAKEAMELAMVKARKYGLGMVVVRQSTHFGMAGYYSLLAADEGMIGMTGTNARPSVAPTYGTRGILGTNPLAVAIPTDEEFNFLIDCATSITQRGKIEKYGREGKETPDGMVVGEDGRYRTDTEGILRDIPLGRAAFLPLGGVGTELGGHKGYGYSTVVEILSAALQGGPCLGAVTGVNVGHFFIAIDVASFRDLSDFRRDSGQILRELRASRKDPSAERIYTAGELEYLTWLERREKGIPLGRSLREDIEVMGDELSVDWHHMFGRD